jgi:hypothetical protein
VFTGDYDLNEDGTYFDKENGWKKGVKYTGGEIAVKTTCPHFGQKSLYVKEACGVVNNFKVNIKKEYVLSAWVRPLPGKTNLRFGVDFYTSNGTYIGAFDSLIQGLQTNAWNYVEHRIKTTEIGKPEHLHRDRSVTEIASYDAWIGRIEGDPANKTEFYMDDVRFYPSNALVTTTYYDEKWQLPILTIDANSNPGKRIEYDDWGRPLKTFKVVNKTSDRSTDIELSRNEYHLWEELLPGTHIQLLTPDGGNTIGNGSTVEIRWVMDQAGAISIGYTDQNDQGYTQFHTAHYVAGTYSIDWTVNISGNRKIKVINTTTNEYDLSDGTFFINTLPTAPTNLNANQPSSSNVVNFTWTASTDIDPGTITYRIYIDGHHVDNVTTNSYSRMFTVNDGCPGFPPPACHEWYVVAVDANGGIMSSASGRFRFIYYMY